MTAALDPKPTEQANLPKRPVLQPKETVPVTGNYVLKDSAGTSCIKLSMGVEYIVIEKKVGAVTFSALFV